MVNVARCCGQCSSLSGCVNAARCRGQKHSRFTKLCTKRAMFTFRTLTRLTYRSQLKGPSVRCGQFIRRRSRRKKSGLSRHTIRVRLMRDLEFWGSGTTDADFGPELSYTPDQEVQSPQPFTVAKLARNYVREPDAGYYIFRKTDDPLVANAGGLAMDTTKRYGCRTFQSL